MCDQLFTYLYDSIHLKSYIHVNLFQTQVKYLHHFTYPKNMEHVRFPWLLNHQLSETKTYPIYFRFVSISLRKNLPWKSHGPDDFPSMSGPESRPRCGQNSDPRLFPWPDSILYVKCARHTNEYGPLNRGHIHKREGKKPKNKKGGVKLEDVDSGHSSSPFSTLS